MLWGRVTDCSFTQQYWYGEGFEAKQKGTYIIGTKSKTERNTYIRGTKSKTLDAISKMTEGLCSFPRQTIQYHSNPTLSPDQ